MDRGKHDGPPEAQVFHGADWLTQEFIYDIQQEQSWGALAERIIDQHID